MSARESNESCPKNSSPQNPPAADHEVVLIKYRRLAGRDGAGVSAISFSPHRCRAGGGSRFDDFQTGNAAELAGVECGDRPAAMDCGCGNKQVVGADHLPCLRELRPNPGLDPRQGCIQRHNLEPAESILQPTAAASGPRCVRFGFYAKPEFGNRDGAGRNGFRRARAEPGGQIELLAFVGNQHRTIERFLSGLRAFRPLRTVAPNARRSSVLSSAPARSSASSWLLHPCSAAGTKRAYGTPFFTIWKDS